MKRILIVEDDPRLSRSLSDQLMEAGYPVQAVYDGHMALRALREPDLGLVLLDLGLPGVDGYTVCRELRSTNENLPVIVLTAFSDIDSKTTAFDLGADDYLVKPVHFKELLAKVRVFLKRSESNPVEAGALSVADLQVDLRTKKATRAGKPLELSPKEFHLLVQLLRNRDRVLSKDDLAESVWSDSHTVSPNTIEVYVSFLRAKVDKGFDRKLIHTRHGFGYMLSTEAP